MADPFQIPEMSHIMEIFQENPIFLILAAFLLAFIGYALVKKLIKIALFVGCFLAIYAGLVYYFG